VRSLESNPQGGKRIAHGHLPPVSDCVRYCKAALLLAQDSVKIRGRVFAVGFFTLLSASECHLFPMVEKNAGTIRRNWSARLSLLVRSNRKRLVLAFACGFVGGVAKALGLIALEWLLLFI
jgi:hypothetical protein